MTRLGGRARWALRWAGRVCGALGAGLAALVLIDHLAPPPDLEALAVSALVTDRDGVPLRAFPLEDGRWRLRADIADVDPAFVRALIAMEDQRFYSHRGVDPRAVARAAASALMSRRVVSGASTITMQTARLLEPRPRTLVSKAIEMFRAFQLERRYSKDEILSAYLTLAPYGGAIEGARAASWAYFGHEPVRLTPDELALLIALPQSPEQRRPDRRPDAAIAARARVLDRLVAAELLAPDRAAEAAAEPAPERGAFPAEAWHAAAEARARAGGAGAAHTVRSTLDAGLQREMEALARETAEAAGDGVQVSIIVVEIATRAVRASVGSAGRARPGGWLDLTDRPRSPGSTLKPFIYALAFDEGVAAPGTLISDLPSRFASYRPENFDRRFRGDVSVAQALQHSLNIPAVATLDALGADRFVAALDFAGAPLRLPDSDEEGAGLAVALGGAGLTARELATLYAALGDDGHARPLVWLADEETDAPLGHTLMTAETAGEILEILRRAPAPEGRAPAALTLSAPDVAFKTGTSYGFRDAWAAGVAEGYAAVVWVGRPDGAPRPGVTGRAAALPVLFSAFDAVARQAGPAPARVEPGRDLFSEPAPAALARFGGAQGPPQILFPPEDAEIWSDRAGRGFVLAGRGEGALDWYADGDAVARDAAGAPVWRPSGPGFYRISAVDARGRETRVTVRVIGGE